MIQKLLCSIGLHNWEDWKVNNLGIFAALYSNFQIRQCKWCRKYQVAPMYTRGKDND